MQTSGQTWDQALAGHAQMSPFMIAMVGMFLPEQPKQEEISWEVYY